MLASARNEPGQSIDVQSILATGLRMMIGLRRERGLTLNSDRLHKLLSIMRAYISFFLISLFYSVKLGNALTYLSHLFAHLGGEYGYVELYSDQRYRNCHKGRSTENVVRRRKYCVLHT